ncbi:MAG: lactate racemase domain-containing protein [Candidatus Limivicinus sp.]|nr:lactate racemase domain-containing protein [Candidatus Limivicinus sp.]
MSSVNDLLKGIPIPRMVPVRQNFDREKLVDVAAEVRKELDRDEVKAKIRPGMSIAITAGSRGIDNLALVIRELVAFLKEQGAEPFVIPAMGSHGGSTAEGQKAVITEYGVTEDYVGCPVRATMETKEIGRLDDGRPILINRLAAEADGIISLNRIKAHTAFRGRYESGVMKMLTIGLGCQAGAEVCHRQGILHLGPNVEKFAFGILANANVILGVGLIENAYDETVKIRVMTKEQIPEEEPLLLDYAKSKMARILFDRVDVMIVDYIGKNISGEGMDPNIAGRWIVPTIKGGIDATRIGILDLTDETLGNFVGLGMADTCSKRVIEKISTENTYPNSLTSTVTELCKLPMYFDNHMRTIQATIKMVPAKSPEEITMIRINSTLAMDTIWISENMLDQARSIPGIEILGEPEYMQFDENGNLFK